MKRGAVVVLVVLGLVAALAYLRDPPWLVHVTSGLTGWETGADGVRYRWTGGHASFFVPADAGNVTLRLRGFKEAPSDWPVTATLLIDDRPVDRVTFDDERWRTVRVRLPPPGERRVRRVDIKLDRLRSGQRGLQLAPGLPPDSRSVSGEEKLAVDR